MIFCRRENLNEQFHENLMKFNGNHNESKIAPRNLIMIMMHFILTSVTAICETQN